MTPLILQFLLIIFCIIVFFGIIRVCMSPYRGFGHLVLEIFWLDILWIFLEFLAEILLWVVVGILQAIFDN